MPMRRLMLSFRLFLGSSLLSLMTVGNLVDGIAAQPNPSTFERFADWCENKEKLPLETRHTVEVLLAEAGSQECDRADEILGNLTELQLSGHEIVDVKPISTLTNLTDLALSFNQIAEIKPLSVLTNLRWLNLAGNKITDVESLSKLTNLTGLSLHSNQIVDIQPLSRLTKLNILHLQYNQIVNIDSLSGLKNLEWLNLGGNPLAKPICPVKPETICQF
jgi:internalin A